jgi:hypothetical protein
MVRRGFKFTYHFRIVWQRLEQVIQQSQRRQNVATQPDEPIQNVPTEPVQNVAATSAQWQQNVSTKWKQNVSTPDTYRDNNTENKETEKTDRENQTTWNKTIEQLRADLPIEEVEARLTGTTLIEVTDTAARIGVPNRYAIAWLERKMYREISNAMKSILGKDLDLQFITA